MPSRNGTRPLPGTGRIVHLAILADTAFGPVVAAWTSKGGSMKITRVLVSKPGLPATVQAAGLFPESTVASCPAVDAVLQGMAALMGGEAVAFPLDVAEMDQCPPFQQQVLRAEHAIPRGRVSTYSLIARRLGIERGARAVGNALATNPFPLIVPCHRAIRSDLTLGGYQGGLAMKRALLEAEGMAFDDAGRVLHPDLHYRT